MTMLDKLEAVIEAHIRPAMPIYDWDSRAIARAALEAIREPSEEMLASAADVVGVSATMQMPTTWPGIVAIHAAMIDAILSEKA